MWVPPMEKADVNISSESETVVKEAESNADGNGTGVSEGGTDYTLGFGNVAYDLTDLSERGFVSKHHDDIVTESTMAV